MCVSNTYEFEVIQHVTLDGVLWKFDLLWLINPGSDGFDSPDGIVDYI